MFCLPVFWRGNTSCWFWRVQQKIRCQVNLIPTSKLQIVMDFVDGLMDRWKMMGLGNLWKLMEDPVFKEMDPVYPPARNTELAAKWQPPRIQNKEITSTDVPATLFGVYGSQIPTMHQIGGLFADGRVKHRQKVTSNVQSWIFIRQSWSISDVIFPKTPHERRSSWMGGRDLKSMA